MTVDLWGRWEQVFVANDQPAPDTELHVSLTSPGGTTKTVPGFWDGGRIWRVRFRPDETGTWEYTTTASDEACELHGQSGSFDCASSESENVFFKHGPVGVSGEGTHFEHADGRPFFFLGDTVWNGPMLSTERDWDDYLVDRIEKRFTAVQFVTQAPWIGAFTAAGGAAAVTGNPSMPANPSFFHRIDARMDAVNEVGLLAVPVLAWAATWNETARKFNVGCFLPEDQLIAFVKYQVARYQAHHVVWILPGDGKYEGEEAEKWRRVGRAVFGEGEHAPVSLHPCGRHWPYESFRDETWCSVWGYQSSHNDHDNTIRYIQTGEPAAAWKKAPARPVMNIEPCYEDHVAGTTRVPFTDEKVRLACYWSLLSAPTAGLTYGAHGMWAWHDREEVPLHHPGSGPGMAWRDAKDLPGAAQMRHLVDCFERLDWWRLKPDPGLLVEQPGADDPNEWIAASSTGAKDQALIYLPRGGRVKLRLGGMKSGLSGEWFDPRTGRVARADLRDGNVKAPDEKDWVLVLRS